MKRRYESEVDLFRGIFEADVRALTLFPRPYLRRTPPFPPNYSTPSWQLGWCCTRSFFSSDIRKVSVSGYPPTSVNQHATGRRSLYASPNAFAPRFGEDAFTFNQSRSHSQRGAFLWDRLTVVVFPGFTLPAFDRFGLFECSFETGVHTL